MAKIIHISDTHIYGKNHTLIKDKITGLKHIRKDNFDLFEKFITTNKDVIQTDIVIVTGDIVYTEYDKTDDDIKYFTESAYRKFATALAEFHVLNPKAKIYIIPGNHDVYDIMETELSSRYTYILRDKSVINIDGNELLLIHNPDDIDHNKSFDLALSGHMHKYIRYNDLKRLDTTISSLKNKSLNVGSFSFQLQVNKEDAEIENLIQIGTCQDGSPIYKSSYYNVYNIVGNKITILEKIYKA